MLTYLLLPKFNLSKTMDFPPKMTLPWVEKLLFTRNSAINAFKGETLIFLVCQ